LRITVMGASHTEADFFTGALRRSLQTRWGDGGHGFVLPAAPYRAYRAQDVDLCYSPGWSGDWAGKGGKAHFPGIGGLVVTSGDPARFGWVGTTTTNLHGGTVSHWTLFLQGQPGGGDLLVEVDGAEPLLQDTRRGENTLIAVEIQVPPGAHRLTLRPAGNGPITLLGLSAEAAASGVIVDAMGVRGSTIRNWAKRNDAVFTEGLQTLNPDLVVLAYGTNEAMDPRYALADYKRDLRAGLEVLHQALPLTDCILVGPSDRSLPLEDGRIATWERTRKIAAIQAEVALEAGCASWSWQAATGGPGSQASWRQQEPAWVADDWIHFTPEGYEEVARRFLWALDSAG
jgi:lysophospholipase L1-like esterase